MSLNRRLSVLNSHATRVLLNRPLIDSIKDSQINVTLTRRFRSKMAMPNQRKLLSQLKELLIKSGYDKNVQFVLSKEWMEMLEKVTYAQINTIRKLILTDSVKGTNNFSTEPTEINTTVKLPDRPIKSDDKVDPKNTRKEVGPTPSNYNHQMKEQINSLPQFLADWVQKLTHKSTVDVLVTPKWKINIDRNIPKHGIVSRTRHVLNSIVTAESNASKWRRIEDLINHINQYPDARHYAIKEGAIPILLRARQKSKDEQIKGCIREVLALLGYIDPLPGRGIRILSIDGGGIRGVLVIEMLKKLEQLTGKKTHEMFDYICGVSTGAILSAVLAFPKELIDIGGHKRKSLEEVSELYKDLSTKVFTQNAIKGTSNLVWSHAYYDTSLWEQMLQEHLGHKVMIKTARDPNSPKFAIVSTVVNQARVMAFVFRNYSLPHGVESQYIGSHKHEMWEAVRASAAAPSYFEEFKLGEFLHQDGGILVNNPCAVAIHEAKQLWPLNPIQCVVSFGTGRVLHKTLDEPPIQSTDIAISSWRDKFYKILDSATDTEAVHTTLNDLLPDHTYFRFNPYLTEMLTMVEIRPDKLEQLEQDAKMYIRRNETKFEKTAAALLESKPVQQKFKDWIELQKRLMSSR